MDTIYSMLYIEDGRLYDYAVSCARLLKTGERGSGRAAALELRQNYLSLRRCHDELEQRYGDSAAPPAACEWLLDNFYMIRREFLPAYSLLRQTKRLRSCPGGTLITELCKALVQAGHGEVTEERCRIFLEGFQSVAVLGRSELCLFPTALRCALIADLAECCRKLRYAADTEPHARAMAALFSSLRLFSVLDTEKLLSAADVASAILSADPTGDYESMDGQTRREYLLRLEALAEREGIEEHELARRLIRTATREGRHIGFYLFRRPGRGGEGLYIAANLLSTLFLALLAAFALDSLWLAALLLLPVSELVKSFIDYVLLRLVRPRPLPRMDMENGVPPEGRSICVISVILGGDEGARLEELRLASRSEGKNLLFGLLADLPGSDTETTENDAELLRRSRREVERLNRKYGGGFYLFTRKRSFNGESWCGHERKRGAILELARLLCGEKSELAVTGDKDALKTVRYIITLDGDTRIYPGSLGELIGAALHPLCRPIIDKKQKRVVAGHAILHPRIETELESAGATDFALIFAGAGGTDPYGALCGELYMDAFDSGGFAGKGLIDAKALLECAGSRFPEGRILSHDALEGAYLRGGYMGDTAFSDRFPALPLAYYRRLHRWVRGDWQNAPWIFKRELTDMERFRLFDSLRRSLIAPATFIAITAGFFIPGRGLETAGWAALLALLSNLLIALAEGGRARRGKLRRHTRLLTGIGGAIVQSFIRLWLLPYEAFVCLGAICTSLWRMLVSRKKLLQWQTAAQSEKGASGFGEHIRAMWFPVALGVLLMAFSPAIIGKASGLMWLMSPAAAAALALPARRDRELGTDYRKLILDAASESWKYLSEFSLAEDNFLPPDNFQEQPPIGAAHRTSPTNIGLALAAATASADMGICTREAAAAYIDRAVGTLEKMPRLMGHFYNWYDTLSLRPMKPAYISTVDSGNLCAGLLSAASAMEEWGKIELCGRLRALAADMDFSPLYDKGRGLFYICYDAENHRGAGGWYDLLASESMLTSYLAAARGDVPVKHWRRLSRAQLQKDGYRGLASWTGTMFEYLMPFLFLPVYRGSLLCESGRFCVYAQKKRVGPGLPWGISESAFYALDASMSYRYKAHGCPALALKRGQEADAVVSPYSSFLALAIDPIGAAKNLRRLKDFGAMGRFGFIEALDFTPGRCRSETGEPVRCYMAHHVSMSVIAAANALCDRSVAARFMAEPDMKAFSLLLQEKLPSDAPVIRRDMSEAPEKPRRDLSRQWQVRGGAEDKELRCALLSNGAYSLLLSSSGRSSARVGNLSVYRGEPDFGGPELCCNGKSIMPAAIPSMWELGEERGRFSCEAGDISCSTVISAASGDCGELRTVELVSPSGGSTLLELGFEPVLAEPGDCLSHPAYWKLGMEAQTDDGRLLLRRLPKGKHKGLWLCAGCSERAELSADRHGGLGGLSAPYVRITARIELEPGKPRQVSFVICVSPERAEASAGAERILLSRGAAPGCMPGAAAAHLGMSGEELGAAMDMLLPLWQSPLHEAAPRRELWRYGISGELPIICCDGRASESDRLLRRFCLLKSCGVNSELVFFSDEEGEYMQPLLSRISRALSAVGLEALIGSPGGVFLVPSSEAEIIKSRASVSVGDGAKHTRPLPEPYLSAGRSIGSVPEHRWTEGGFEFLVKDSLPSRVWQHMLTNGSFGYIATDCGMGNMWLKNAREMRVGLPPEDPRSVRGPERIYLERGGERFSVFAANDGLCCRVHFSPGLAVWKKELEDRRIRTSAFIPAGVDARVLIIDGAEGLRLTWQMKLIFGGADGSAVICREKDGGLTVENPESYLSGERLALRCSVPAKCRCDFVPAGAELSLICEEKTVLVCGCCSEAELMELCSGALAMKLMETTAARWAGLLGRFRLKSRDLNVERYMNGWAAYQCIACRLQGRSSLYQSGGALGFRDQLQDGVNMLLLSADYARERILDCCRHQYVEGDVMHWWHPHPQGDRGVRSRCSDDLLWLCWALCEYAEKTGDYALCLAEEPYISSAPLLETEDDRYERPERSAFSASVLDHARAALERCVSRGFGSHGLPLFGSGDWNDALDGVDGESVWLGWFFSHCARRFAELLEKLQKPDSRRYRELGEKVGAAADKCNNGRWYLRGYYADGEALGDGRIDSLPQSWAVLSGVAPSERADAALDEALSKLVDRRHGLVKLFEAPYTEDQRRAGYISGYGRGFRENGGQYTHGAIWLAMAALRRGRAQEGREILRMLTGDGRDARVYEGEPFVLAADVYSAEGREGEAGWTWYTGSAGWYFRAVTEELLGLRLRSGRLSVSPPLLSAVAGCSVEWTDRQGLRHSIRYGEKEISVDGEPYSGGELG